MRAMLAELGDPQTGLQGALIAGTNGKGSVAAMVAAILAAAGHSTMQSPSPHLHSYRERILIDGRPIAAGDLDDLLEEVLRASEPGEPAHGAATEFELLTAAAYLWSACRHVDVVVMEVGLGGRMDASNGWDPDVAAVTNIGLDHREFLGDTIESIAAEKAAIIKPGSLAVTGAHGAALRVIRARADSLRVPLTVTEPPLVETMDPGGLVLRDAHLGRLDLPLLGRHQAENAGVALGIVAALGQCGVATVPDDAIRSGLASTRWPGRSEWLTTDGHGVLLDGAHNPDGMTALAATVDELAGALPQGRATLLIGVMADKEVERMMSALAGSEVLRAATVITTSVPDSDRGMGAQDLAAAWSAATGSREAMADADVEAALVAALEQARSNGGPLVVAGSLYLVGHVRARLLPAEVSD